MTVKKKPLVVLAGWLGCQQRSLRRYEELFTKKGFQVLSTVATPTQVAECCFRPLPSPSLQCPSDWPHTNHKDSLTSSSDVAKESMQSHAWNILQEVHQHQSPYIVFYAFSNGGCFVWQEVRRILHAAATADKSSQIDRLAKDNNPIQNLEEEQHSQLLTIQQRMAGVVFDSCPSRQLALMGFALAFCTWKERFNVAKAYGFDVVFSPPFLSQSKKTIANLRSVAYYRGLKEDPWELPQLYLYSHNDMLIPSTVVEDLVLHRRDMLGADRILSHKWMASRHCAHFVDHAEEYEATLDSFLDVCRPKTKVKDNDYFPVLRSKL